MLTDNHFLKLYFRAKIGAFEGHLNSIDEKNPNNLLRVISLRSKLDLLEEIKDDLEINPKPDEVIKFHNNF